MWFWVECVLLLKNLAESQKCTTILWKTILVFSRLINIKNFTFSRIPNSRNTFWTIALNAWILWSMETLCWNTNITVNGKKSLAMKWKCTKHIFHTKKKKKKKKLKNFLFHHLNLDTKTVLWKIGCDEYIIQKFN